VVLLALPCAVALLLFPQPLIAVLFHYGAFGARDVAMTVQALMGYGIGLLGLIAIKVLAPGFYARQDTRTPVRIAVISLAFNMACNLALVWSLRHAGLALSTTLSATLNALLLYRGLRREGVYAPTAGWGLLWLRLTVASIAMAAVLLWGAGDVAQWLAMSRGDRVLALAGWIAAGAAVYAGTLLALGTRLRDFRGR
jgi:putative peptidoglycan lipid II flippase